MDIVIPGINESTANNLCNKIEEKTRFYESILSCYHPDAEVYKINQVAFLKTTEVSDTLQNIISECTGFYKNTQGYFNVGLQKIKHSKASSFQNEDFNIAEKIHVDKNHSIRYTSENIALDFGAIGKGYVLREVSNILTEYEIENCLISFGGSSFLTRGRHPHGEYWPVSLRETYNNNMAFKLNNHAASISCTYSHTPSHYHIINPKTLEYVSENKLTYVQCKCPVIAEMLSTAISIMPFQEIKPVLDFYQIEKAYIFIPNQKKEQSIIYSHGE